MSEKCARCGEVDDDRRTLWMRCFYDMSELGLPFELCENAGLFYALRVCKACRADWMRAIKNWFTERPPLDTNTGVYIRDLGNAREATEDEVKAMGQRL